jgi:predicted butyrate kinase (DUF1464 family)
MRTREMDGPDKSLVIIHFRSKRISVSIALDKNCFQVTFDKSESSFLEILVVDQTKKVPNWRKFNVISTNLGECSSFVCTVVLSRSTSCEDVE